VLGTKGGQKKTFYTKEISSQQLHERKVLTKGNKGKVEEPSWGTVLPKKGERFPGAPPHKVRGGKAKQQRMLKLLDDRPNYPVSNVS